MSYPDLLSGMRCAGLWVAGRQGQARAGKATQGELLLAFLDWLEQGVVAVRLFTARQPCDAPAMLFAFACLLSTIGLNAHPDDGSKASKGEKQGGRNVRKRQS